MWMGWEQCIYNEKSHRLGAGICFHSHQIAQQKGPGIDIFAEDINFPDQYFKLI